ncbi:hypothetical protein BH20VER3_BH20VER3_00980 [soil metagenome]
MKNFQLSPFKTGEPLLAQLSAERMNAILDAVDRVTPLSGQNTRVQVTPGGRLIHAQPAGQTGAAAKTPFLVFKTSDNSVPPYPILKLVPGKIAGIVPTLNAGGTNAAGAKLDVPDDASGAHPWLYTPGHDFSIYLRCNLDLVTPSSQYRSVISSVRVVTSDDADAVVDRANNTQELQIVWEGATQAEKDQKTKGHFYVNVADVKGGTDGGGNITIGTITQWLFDSYTTFAVAGDSAVILV